MTWEDSALKMTISILFGCLTNALITSLTKFFRINYVELILQRDSLTWPFWAILCTGWKCSTGRPFRPSEHSDFQMSLSWLLISSTHPINTKSIQTWKNFSKFQAAPRPVFKLVSICMCSAMVIRTCWSIGDKPSHTKVTKRNTFSNSSSTTKITCKFLTTYMVVRINHTLELWVETYFVCFRA